MSNWKMVEIEARAERPEYGLRQAADVGLLLIDLREARTALKQAALDIMNLGAFLRLEGKTELADIAAKQEAAARAALGT